VEKTYKKLIKELDAIYSKYIRKRDKGVCFTCGKEAPQKKMQAGHYISRRVLSCRYYDKNVHCQCVACNIYKEGNKPAYALALQKKYGKGILEELDSLSHISIKYTRGKLSGMIFYYKEKYGEENKT